MSSSACSTGSQASHAVYIYIHIYMGSIPGRVIPKTLKMVLDTSLLNTHQYKVRIEGKVEQSRERSSALPLHLGVVTIEKEAFWSPSTTVNNNLYIYIYIYICVCVCVCVYVYVCINIYSKASTNVHAIS